VPKVKYCCVPTRRDPLKGLVLEYKALKRLDETSLALLWGVSRATCSKRLNRLHSDLWLTEAKDICRKLDVPIEAFREAMRY
jgi:hypothetical protein